MLLSQSTFTLANRSPYRLIRNDASWILSCETLPLGRLSWWTRRCTPDHRLCHWGQAWLPATPIQEDPLASLLAPTLHSASISQGWALHPRPVETQGTQALPALRLPSLPGTLWDSQRWCDHSQHQLHCWSLVHFTPEDFPWSSHIRCNSPTKNHRRVLCTGPVWVRQRQSELRLGHIFKALRGINTSIGAGEKQEYSSGTHLTQEIISLRNWNLWPLK